MARPTMPADHHEPSGPSPISAWLYFSIMVIAGIAALVPRVEKLKTAFSGQYLWAEDGPIFMGQAQTHGLAAFLEAYGGYLHFYPRLVAFLANTQDLIYRPGIYLVGWLLAYGVMIYAVARAARAHGVGLITTLVLVLLVAFQPAFGDVLFNITNAQWMLGGAMILLLLVDPPAPPQRSWVKGAFLLPMALTGPFSIIVTPLVLLKAYLKRDFRTHAWAYGAVLLGAAVQTASIVNTGRATYLVTSTDPWGFVLAFMQLALFGAGTFLQLALALLFWAVLLVAFKRLSASEAVQPLFLLAALLLMLVSVLYSVKSSPMSAAALGGGNRFTWIPYTLAFTLAFLVSARQPLSRWVMVLCAALLCWQNFRMAPYVDYQFQSFARWAKVIEVGIPINPGGGFYVNGSGYVKSPWVPLQDDPFDFRDIKLNALIEQPGEAPHTYIATGNDPAIFFNHPLVCPNATHAALEFDMKRNSEGFVQLFWNSFPGFTEEKSMERWYPAGSVTAQFAFPIAGSETHIRLDPMRGKGTMSIENVRSYCLE